MRVLSKHEKKFSDIASSDAMPGSLKSHAEKAEAESRKDNTWINRR